MCKIHLEGTKITSEATNDHVGCYVRLEGLARIITYECKYRAKLLDLSQLLRLLLAHQRKEVTHHLTKTGNIKFKNYLENYLLHSHLKRKFTCIAIETFHLIEWPNGLQVYSLISTGCQIRIGNDWYRQDTWNVPYPHRR